MGNDEIVGYFHEGKTHMPKVLVVDDTASLRQLLELYLVEEGIDVITSSSGEDALQKVSKYKVDAVITDIVMPGMSGLELCRKIKNIPTYSKLPIVACSTRNTDLDFFWAKKNGISSYITKPVDRQKFIETIKSVLKSYDFDNNESKNAKEYIQDFVDALNHILTQSRKYLGPKVSDKYLWVSKPDFKWLDQFQIDAVNKIVYVENKSHQREINEVHEHQLKKWLNKFLNQCSQTILDFESELEPSYLEFIEKLLDYTALNAVTSIQGQMPNPEPLLTWTEVLE